MKQWIFEHIIMKIFDKEFYNWYHKEVYEPMMTPLPDNWWENILEEEKEELLKRSWDGINLDFIRK